jgi:hypothetical protein
MICLDGLYTVESRFNYCGTQYEIAELYKLRYYECFNVFELVIYKNNILVDVKQIFREDDWSVFKNHLRKLTEEEIMIKDIIE